MVSNDGSATPSRTDSASRLAKSKSAKKRDKQKAKKKVGMAGIFACLGLASHQLPILLARCQPKSNLRCATD